MHLAYVKIPFPIFQLLIIVDKASFQNKMLWWVTSFLNINAFEILCSNSKKDNELKQY